MLNLQDQQKVLSNFSGLAVDACALLLNCDDGTRNRERALQLLELGRGAIADLAMNSCVDISRLRVSHPGIAERFEQLQFLFDSRDNEKNVCSRSPFELSEDLNRCIQDIRTLPGYDRFLLAPSIAEIQLAASDGYIILVNISDIRSDAIIVSKEAIESIPLPDFSYIKAAERVGKRLTFSTVNESPEAFGERNKEYRSFLLWLWENCVKPILRTVGISRATPLPRVWWIGTGIASSMPFHAAGELNLNRSENTMSQVVSSYIPTIRSLLFAKERSKTTLASHNALRKLLLVSMPTTPGEINIPGVEDVAVIETSFKELLQVTKLDKPTASDVFHQLKRHDVVHFACHGISHAKNPLHSALVLQKTGADSTKITKDLLTVESLLQRRSQPAQLAFLSAYSTAENKVTSLADESIHIASAFFIVGFSNVIGSLWLSNDRVCVSVAERFYASLVEAGSGISCKGSAYALHNAVLEIQSRDLKCPLLWAQYIHIGP